MPTTSLSRIQDGLVKALDKINRPGSFAVGGSIPALLPGLEVKGLGQIGLPLAAAQAKELIEHCEQAPYGKGQETLVDTSVRKVWRLTPKKFQLTNPIWELVLKQVVSSVQSELGLEKQKLQSHLYDLLLYEPGGFFLPHQDGEKLDGMVATLVVVLPSEFKGGELVVRHEGEEKAFDFNSKKNAAFEIHYAAFYADCEHEIRPLRSGLRLCLVYNLTLAKSKKVPSAPRKNEHAKEIGQLLKEWNDDENSRKLAITLGHQYTEKGLDWSALKGEDRMQAAVLRDAALAAGCEVHLALLTLHESGSSEGEDYDYDSRSRTRRSRYSYEEDEDEDEDGDDTEAGSEHEMGEIYESSLVAEHWSDATGASSPIGLMHIEEEELLQPDLLRAVISEEYFEGYTGNAGMTLDRWYRHAAIIIWPKRRHFDVLCDCGISRMVPVFAKMVADWKKAKGKKAEALRAECMSFGKTIIENWPVHTRGNYQIEEDKLLPALAGLEDAGLIEGYITSVLRRDASLEPGAALAKTLRKHGWKRFQAVLLKHFKKTTFDSFVRDCRLLQDLCANKSAPSSEQREVCSQLAIELMGSLHSLPKQLKETTWRMQEWKRESILQALLQSLLAIEHDALLEKLVEDVLADPKSYPLREVLVPVLTSLGAWLTKNVRATPQGLARLVNSCLAELESITITEPKEPTDFAREVTSFDRSQFFPELKAFLENPNESERAFRTAQGGRQQIVQLIRSHQLDLDTKEVRKGSPYLLICTKNTNSFGRNLKLYHEDCKRLEQVQKVAASLSLLANDS